MSCVLIVMGSTANADLLFTLSSPEDLSTLKVGQTFEVDVKLSGLPVGSDFIFNLNTKILFSSSLFQAVSDPTSTSGLTATDSPPSVFGNTLQVANFNAQSSLTAGAAIGNFSESPNTMSGAIGLNGLYYSFILQANAAGSGSISFDSTPGANEYAADDTGFNSAPLPTSGPLSFTISPAAVPEPASIVLCGIASLCLGGFKWRNRKPVAA